MHTLRLSPPVRRGASLALAGLAALLAACSPPPQAEEPVRSVKVITVGLSDVQSRLEYAAEVRPRIESRLGFRVAGKIASRKVELGQTVKAGQLLAQLDPQDYRLAADAARAQVAAARTNLELAQSDYKRYVALKEQNFISGAEVERRDTTLKAAQAQYDQAQAQLSSQGNQAAYTNLVADVSGVVTAIEAEPGQVVTAGTPVIRIAQAGPRDAVFGVPEDKVAAVRVGTDVAVRVWANGTEIKGSVREVAASADAVTRTFQVKVALPLGDATPPLGSTVYVLPSALGPQGSQAIKLPTSALRQDGKATAVWVLDKGSMTVRLQPVEVLTADGNDAVISSGLTPGMLVVGAGVHVLSPGQKVTVFQDKYAAARGEKPVDLAAAPTAPTAPAAPAAPAASAAASK